MTGKDFLIRSCALLLGAIFSILILEIILRLAGHALTSFQDNANKASLAAGGYRILCVGESTTADMPPSAVSYPRQLGEILNMRGGGRKFSVINKGMHGGNTSMIVAELVKNLDIYRPDVVIAMMGLNDSESDALDRGAARIKGYRLENMFRTYKFLRLLFYTLKHKKKVDELLENPSYLGTAFDPFREDGQKKAGQDEAERREAASGHLLKNEFDEAEKVYGKSMEKNQSIVWEYLNLADVYDRAGLRDRAEEAYRKVIDGRVYGDKRKNVFRREPSEKAHEREQQWLLALLALGRMYSRYDKYDEAEEVFKQMIATKPDLAYSELAEVYEKRGNAALAGECRCKAEEYSPENANPVTRMNFKVLKETLDARGIKLVCMQYPLRNVDLLKKAFDDPSGVIFVDNEKTFREALARGSYYEYFIDRCRADFGHCTTKGNRLIAENAAQGVFEAVKEKEALSR